MQVSHQELQQQLEGQLEWWRQQVDDLKAQLRGEATRVLELQKKAYNAKMAQEAATQVRPSAAAAAVIITVSQPCIMSASLKKLSFEQGFKFCCFCHCHCCCYVKSSLSLEQT